MGQGQVRTLQSRQERLLSGSVRRPKQLRPLWQPRRGAGTNAAPPTQARWPAIVDDSKSFKTWPKLMSSQSTRWSLKYFLSIISWLSWWCQRSVTRGAYPCANVTWPTAGKTIMTSGGGPRMQVARCRKMSQGWDLGGLVTWRLSGRPAAGQQLASIPKDV